MRTASSTAQSSDAILRHQSDGSRSKHSADTEYYRSLLHRKPFLRAEDSSGNGRRRGLAACINRPCIKADDECYNCEWSTELFVPQAMEEYIKAWFLLKVISKEFGLGSMNGFQFNISVGYDLAGIKSEKVDTFLNTMQHAQDSEIFKALQGLSS